MYLLLLIILITYNIIFKACHTRCDENQPADGLSLKQVCRFQQLTPDAQSEPERLLPDFQC